MRIHQDPRVNDVLNFFSKVNPGQEENIKHVIEKALIEFESENPEPVPPKNGDQFERNTTIFSIKRAKFIENAIKAFLNENRV